MCQRCSNRGWISIHYDVDKCVNKISFGSPPKLVHGCYDPYGDYENYPSYGGVAPDIPCKCGNKVIKEYKVCNCGCCSVEIEKYTKFNKNKEGCFITTATLISLQKPDDCNELNAFRKFRDTYMSQNKPELIAEYYQIAPQIVASIDVRSSKEDIYKKLWENELSKCLSHIENGENLEAMEEYQAMVLTLKSKFLK